MSKPKKPRAVVSKRATSRGAERTEEASVRTSGDSGKLSGPQAARDIVVECPPPPRSDWVELALKLLEGGDVLGTQQPASRHRDVPEQVSVNATSRPRHACRLSDGSELQQPIDVMATAAHTALVILDRWRHLATRGHGLNVSEAVAVYEQAQTLAACVVLIDDLAPRLETVLRPFGDTATVGGIEAQSGHAWCAEAGRQVLWRAFPRDLFGSGTIAALRQGRLHAARIPAEVDPSMPVELGLVHGNSWLREIPVDDLRKVGRRILGEHSGAWATVAATPGTVPAPRAVEWAAIPGYLQPLVQRIVATISVGTAFGVGQVIAKGIEDKSRPKRKLEELVKLGFLIRGKKGERSPYRWTQKPTGMPEP